MQKTPEQSNLLLVLVKKSVQPDKPLAASFKSVIEGSDHDAMTGNGQLLNILV